MTSDLTTVPPASATNDLIDLRSIGLIVRRRLRLLLIVAAVVFVLALAVILVLPDRYTGTANILIDRRTTDVTDVSAVLSGLPADSASVDTEVQVLQSPALIRRVVRELRLDRDPEFNPTLAPPSFLSSVKSGIGSLFGGGAGGGTRSVEDIVVANVAGDLDVDRQGLTYVIGVSFTSLDPKTAARVANAIVAEYLAGQVAEKRNAARSAQDYLTSRLSGLSSDLQGKERAAQALRARTGLPSNDRASTFDEGAIQDLNRQAIQLQSDLAEKQAQYDAARAARNNPSAMPEVIESNVIRDLKAQRAQAVGRNADIANRYGPLHPETEKARREVANLDAEIASETGRIAASLADQVAVARGRLSVIQGALARQRGEAVANSRSAVAVGQYDREADASRDLYQDFLKRTKETATTGDLAKADASLVSPAQVPNKPSKPNRPVFAVLAAIVALGLGAVAVVIAELIDVKISSARDVEHWLELPRIASIPGVPRKDRGNPWALVAAKPLSSYAESFRGLTSYMRGRGQQPKVLMVSSALPHEGKTTVAAALAASLATAGRRVLLIDTDLRRPHLATALGLERPQAGIGEVAAGTATAAQAIVRLAEPALDVLMVGASTPDAELFRGEAFADLIASLRQSYDHIVIDTPPVLAINDPRYVAPLADAVLFVVRWRRTSRFAAASAVDLLRSVGAPLAGVILNNVDFKTQALYSKDDALSFYGAYRQYYTE